MCVQLADDFADLGAHRSSAGSDELNLVYVAITRAMLGLVCNRNVATLLTEKSRKRMELEVGTQVACVVKADELGYHLLCRHAMRWLLLMHDVGVRLTCRGRCQLLAVSARIVLTASCAAALNTLFPSHTLHVVTAVDPLLPVVCLTNCAGAAATPRG